MAALSTAAEYNLVREAIQTLTGTGAALASFTVDGQSYSYRSTQLADLQAREIELARRLTVRNTRKRTVPEFY
jgi:hypothetical protein